MKINFNTNEYRFANGYPPRGIGQWAFLFEYPGGKREIWFAPGSISYGTAKKLALAESKNRPGIWRIVVAS